MTDPTIRADIRYAIERPSRFHAERLFELHRRTAAEISRLDAELASRDRTIVRLAAALVYEASDPGRAPLLREFVDDAGEVVDVEESSS